MRMMRAGRTRARVWDEGTPKEVFGLAYANQNELTTPQTWPMFRRFVENSRDAFDANVGRTTRDKAWGGESPHPINVSQYVLAWCSARNSRYQGDREPEEQLRYLREIVDNPFAPTVIDPAWLSGDVVAMAKLCRDDPRSFPVLWDALEDAGCDSQRVREHCLQSWHHRECWLLHKLLEGVE